MIRALIRFFAWLFGGGSSQAAADGGPPLTLDTLEAMLSTLAYEPKKISEPASASPSSATPGRSPSI
jgi:hypothetical protein